MNHGSSTPHPSAEQLQAFLEGELPARDLAHTEEHLAGCARCASELDGWRVLFADLGDLSAHRPHEGFADRVMASVELPVPLPVGQRVRARVPGLETSAHLQPDDFQDFFDGVLAARVAERHEKHLAQCVTCADEAESWGSVFSRLEGLETFTPSQDFSDHVMAQVDVPVALPFAARVAALLGAPTAEHVPATVLQDFADGMLAGRRLKRVQAHVGGCAACTNDVQAWTGLAARLGTLERFGPSVGFADRVMFRVRIPEAVPAVVRKSIWYHAGAAARRVVPQTRQAWAALSGVAVTPVVVTGLVLYAVFSQPAVTMGSLLSFAWWQVTDVAAVALSGLSGAVLQSADALGVSPLFEALASAPMFVVSGALVYSMVCALALRFLHRHIIANRPARGRYAHVSTS